MSFERKKADSVVSALETAVRKGRAVEYVKGFSSERDEMTEEDLKQACEAAAGADVVVIFAGLPDSFESEGYDRTSMELPKCQNRLIMVAEIQKNVVVVLHNGSPVETPWAESVNAILGDVSGRRRHWGGQRPAVIWGGKSREDAWWRRSHIVWKTTRVT